MSNDAGKAEADEWRSVAARAVSQAHQTSDADLRGLLLTIAWASDRVAKTMLAKPDK